LVNGSRDVSGRDVGGRLVLVGDKVCLGVRDGVVVGVEDSVGEYVGDGERVRPLVTRIIF
jgi:hypothetical protein